MMPSRYCFAMFSLDWNRPFVSVMNLTAASVLRMAERASVGVRQSLRILRPPSIVVRANAAVSASNRLYTSLYIDSASASMFAASTDIAGSRMRSLKSSSDSASSCDVNERSTPLTLATCSVVEDSTTSWIGESIVMPLRTVYWFGMRIFRESPILAPDFANESSY